MLPSVFRGKSFEYRSSGDCLTRVLSVDGAQRDKEASSGVVSASEGGDVCYRDRRPPQFEGQLGQRQDAVRIHAPSRSRMPGACPPTKGSMRLHASHLISRLARVDCAVECVTWSCCGCRDGMDLARLAPRAKSGRKAGPGVAEGLVGAVWRQPIGHAQAASAGGTDCRARARRYLVRIEQPDLKASFDGLTAES